MLEKLIKKQGLKSYVKFVAGKDSRWPPARGVAGPLLNSLPLRPQSLGSIYIRIYSIHWFIHCCVIAYLSA